MSSEQSKKCQSSIASQIEVDCGLASTTAVILAGGLGTRLRPLISDRPKPMAPVADRPFLEYLLDQLNSAGIRHVVICTGYLSEMISSHFGEQYKNMRVSYTEERLLLGTGGGIKFAMPQIESETFFVLNGDSFCNADLLKFYELHKSQNSKASMVLVRVPNTQRYGRVQFDQAQKITFFEEKGVHIGSGWINAGIYLLDKSIFEPLPKAKNISLEKEIFTSMIGDNFYAYCAETTEFIDIGLPESIERANRMFSHTDTQAI
ncbi:MAG: NTP transferase domain-containing protein [Deltaproteobacteria bacterium]|nr:NTP transferase domain-containing protein [Deltaproteobacteria bacterium]